MTGSQVYLRPLTGEDAAAFVPWVNDAEVTRTLAVGAAVMDRQAEQAWIEKMNASGTRCAFRHCRPGDRPAYWFDRAESDRLSDIGAPAWA